MTRFAFLLLCLAVLASCSPPPEVVGRPETPPDVPARSLLPPGDPAASIAYPGATDAAQSRGAGDRRLTALRFTSSAAARDAFTRERDARLNDPAVKSSMAVDALSVRYVRTTAEAASVLSWVSGVWLFIAEARDGPALAALVAASGAGGMSVTSPLQPPVVLATLFVGAALLFVALISGLIFLVVRGTAVRPPPGTPAVPAVELTHRLLGLNAARLPWSLRTGPEADIVAEWKYADASWWGVLAKSGMKKSYRLRLFFDEARRRCGALDEFGEIDWSAGLMAAPRIHYSRSFFRGIQLVRRQREVVYGLQTPTGQPGKVVDYTFDIDEVKQPVIAAVIAAGWTYQPILWPKR